MTPSEAFRLAMSTAEEVDNPEGLKRLWKILERRGLLSEDLDGAFRALLEDMGEEAEVEA